MKHIKTMMALGVIGVDKLSRVDLLKANPILRAWLDIKAKISKMCLAFS